MSFPRSEKLWRTKRKRLAITHQFTQEQRFTCSTSEETCATKTRPARFWRDGAMLLAPGFPMRQRQERNQSGRAAACWRFPRQGAGRGCCGTFGRIRSGSAGGGIPRNRRPGPRSLPIAPGLAYITHGRLYDARGVAYRPSRAGETLAVGHSLLYAGVLRAGCPQRSRHSVNEAKRHRAEIPQSCHHSPRCSTLLAGSSTEHRSKVNEGRAEGRSVSGQSRKACSLRHLRAPRNCAPKTDVFLDADALAFASVEGVTSCNNRL